MFVHRWLPILLDPLEPASLVQRPPQQKLDLAVQAAQIVIGPALNGLENLAIDP
jgi:hypothetical protein